MPLKMSLNSQEGTRARVSFLIKLRAWGLILYFITLKFPSYATREFSFVKISESYSSGILFFQKKIKKKSELLFYQMHYYPFNLKISILVFKRCSLDHFEHKESFGKSRVKITKWSFDLKISILSTWKALVSNKTFNYACFVYLI